MEDIITLFYKVQKDKDDSFTGRANAFIDTYGEEKLDKEIDGPNQKGTS